MRYTYTFPSIIKRKNAFRISSVLLISSLLLIFLLGFTQVQASAFLAGFLVSLWRVIVAYIISFLISIFLALLVMRSKTTEGIFLPILDALQSFPSFSILPLLIVWLGRTNTVVIIVLTIAMIWPMLFTLLSNLKQKREDLEEAAVVFGANGLNKFRFVTLPLLFPAIITGSLVAWGEAWETVLGAEIIIAIPGIGNYLYSQGQVGSSQILIVGIFLLLTILFILNKFIWIPLLNRSTKYQHE